MNETLTIACSLAKCRRTYLYKTRTERLPYKEYASYNNSQPWIRVMVDLDVGMYEKFDAP